MRHSFFVFSLAILFVWGSSGLLSAQTADMSPQPTSFRGIAMGMSIDDVKTKLAADPLFLYRGEPDVNLVPQTEQTLIECAGTTFIHRAYFQFEKGKLLIMILVLDTQRLDYYGLFTTFSKKYGAPQTLDPQKCVWSFSAVTFSLERPLTVKYVERKTFESLVQQGAAQTDLEQVSREKFLEQF